MHHKRPSLYLDASIIAAAAEGGAATSEISILTTAPTKEAGPPPALHVSQDPMVTLDWDEGKHTPDAPCQV